MSLPEEPSRLLQLALSDLRWIEADQRYVVDMGAWHDPGPTWEDRPCRVCLAGAVMARSLHASRPLPSNPECFPGDVAEKLMALDAFRRGNVAIGLGFMRLRPPPEGVPIWMEVPDYAADPEGFKGAMRGLAGLLEGAGQ